MPGRCSTPSTTCSAARTARRWRALRQFGGIQPYPSRVKDGGGGGFLHRLGRPRRGDDQLLRADGRTMSRLHGLGRDRPAAGPAYRHRRRCRTGRGQHLRSPAGRLEARRPQRLVGRSTTTARAWIPSSPTGCSAGSRGCSATWAGTASPSNTAASWKPPSRATAASSCARWIDDCPNSLYSALTFQGGAAWRQALLADLGRVEGTRAIIDRADRRRTRRADDQSRRPRHRDADRGVPRRRMPRATSRPASSPTRSRAWACPSPATRTTTPG